MNARTIQHPGVQMRQIDMSQYRDAIIVNNAYIMGFADKGPIYDYSWITTQSQFIKLYGKPQTEAEKYLYYAVTSVLNNGGTPVVARMPYDNKQCKSYKGLAIRYSGITDDNDTAETKSVDNIKIYGWKDKPQVEQDFYPDYMGENGVLARFGTNAIPLSADVVVPLDKLSTVLGFEEDASTTLGKVSKYLTKNNKPIVSSTIGDVLNIFMGYESDDSVINAYKNIKALIDKVDVKLLNQFTIDKYAPSSYAFEDLSTTINNVFAYIDGNEIDSDVRSELINYIKSDYCVSGLVYYITGCLTGTPSTCIKSTLDGDDDSDYSEIANAYDRFKVTKKYIYNPQIVDLQETYTTLVSTNLNFATISSKLDIPNLSVSFVTEDQKQYISAKFGNDPTYIAKNNETIRRDVINRFLQLKDYVNNKSYTATITDEYKFNGVPLSAINIPPSAIENFRESLTGDAGDYVLAMTLDDIATLEQGDEGFDTALKFARLFNSPSFYDTSSLYDENGYHEATQALIDSKVITKSKLGYKNIIMLDSKEMTISNDQYDDLVTQSKFTDGDNITNPDCKNDINRHFRSDIRSANFFIVDKHKSIAFGEGANEGIFPVIIDPYDGMKAQRLLYHNYSDAELQNNFDPKTIDYYLQQNDIDWRQRVIDQIENQNSLQHVYNADELLVGEQKTGARFKNLMDQWSTPLTGGFYGDSISKNLGRLYPQISIGDVKPGQTTEDYTGIEKTYSSYVVIAVCRTLVDPANGRITIAVIESWFGSLFDEKDPATGESQYIGNKINEGSDYIEFYRNDFVKNPYSDNAFEVRVPQIYMRNSLELKQAADIAGIDLSLYDTNDVYNNLLESDEFAADLNGKYYFTWKDFKDLYTKIVINNCDTLKYAKYDFLYFGERLASIAGNTTFDINDPIYEKIYKDYFEKAQANRFGDNGLTIVPQDFTEGFELYSYSKLIKDLNHKANIFIFDKTDTCLYNNHPVAHFSSFSRKDSQKIIANTTGLAGERQQAVSNVAKNFLIDMDRCIKFIQNIDEVSIFFVVDAGISTIAQFCDNIVWDYYKKDKAFEPVKGGWVTQGYDPEHEQDAQDRQITSLESISTWRAVVAKLDEISKEVRKDCMTIIDAPRQLTLEGAAPKVRRSKPTNDWTTAVGNKLRWISGINSSYTAGYYNWLRVTDTFTGKAFWLPPTCKVIGNYMYLNIQNLPWLAPAGFSYGVVTGIHGISHNPSYKEEDEIYLKSWNYIKQYPYEGFVIEGQKTTLTKNSAFNRVNVRTLFLDLERYVYNMSKGFKYTVNNQYTRQQYVQTLATKFNDYKSRGGIYDYKIVCDQTNNTPQTIDANELRASIYIKPAKLIEFILVDFICTKTGTNFEEII